MQQKILANDLGSFAEIIGREVCTLTLRYSKKQGTETEFTLVQPHFGSKDTESSLTPQISGLAYTRAS